MSKERLEEMNKKVTGLTDRDGDFVDAVKMKIDVYAWFYEQAEKQVIKQVTEKMPGGEKCPSCNVRLIGKANYCGKCGQRIGWKIQGGNLYDEQPIKDIDLKN